MKALLMAAGVGTRLEPLTLAVPKPLVPICNIPVMQYNIELLKKYGIKDIISNLHYFPEQIQGYFKNGASFGAHMRYSYEKNLLGTAGGVLKMAQSFRLEDDNFLVASSDVLMDFNLKALIDFHKRKKSLATIALIEVEDPSEFGAVALDGQKRITAFQEKPKTGEEVSKCVNTGVYVFNKDILSMMPKGRFYDFGKELFPLLVKKGLPFYGYATKSYWKDIGNIQNYKKANFDVLQSKSQIPFGRAQGKPNPKSQTSRSDRDQRQNLKPGILIGKNTKIESGAVLEGNVIIGDDCIVRKGSIIKDSIVWSDVVIDSGVKITSSIIGSWCYLEEKAEIGKDCVIANRCRIKARTKVSQNTSILPDNII